LLVKQVLAEDKLLSPP